MDLARQTAEQLNDQLSLARRFQTAWGWPKMVWANIAWRWRPITQSLTLAQALNQTDGVFLILNNIGSVTPSKVIMMRRSLVSNKD